MAVTQLQVRKPGERTSPNGKPVGNNILLSIPDVEYRRIRPHLEFVDLPGHAMLHEAREKVHFAYFLNRGLASIVVSTKGGRDVEAGVAGFEGVVGTSIAVGLQQSPLKEVMQIEGDAFKVDADALRSVLPWTPDLRQRISRYAVLQGMQVAQTAACNRLHKVAPRLARWLLMAQDRVDCGTLEITHDYLATMLGTDRPSVTLAARALQKKKVIKYNRGSVAILNRHGLESAACECYRVIQQLNGELGLR
ncbi:MAG: Crp/Fnr family transcriptional regulator [Candidatus Acidiferrales bacterium]